jgi:hypothetical protein
MRGRGSVRVSSQMRSATGAFLEENAGRLQRIHNRTWVRTEFMSEDGLNRSAKEVRGCNA